MSIFKRGHKYGTILLCVWLIATGLISLTRASIPYSGPLTPALLRLDPDWDNLRGDARFEKLCQEPNK